MTHQPVPARRGTPPPIDDDPSRHVLEDHAKVYLRLVEGRWEIDPVTLDGSPLDGLEDGPECSDADTQHRRHDCPLVGDRVPPLPTARQLFCMLADEIGPLGMVPDELRSWIAAHLDEAYQRLRDEVAADVYTPEDLRVFDERYRRAIAALDVA
jgi:hypothetical protein